MFGIRWERTAMDELAVAWVQAGAGSRQAITNAIQRIDELLHSDPVGCSESRDDGRRILIVPPLALTFRVEAASRIVSVVHVWFYQRRGS